MNVALDPSLAAAYTSNSQAARVMTEAWAGQHLHCPNCTSMPLLNRLPNNVPVADLQCPHCAAQYELKAKADNLGRTISGGAYQTMLDRLRSATNPHLVVMRYERAPSWQVRDVYMIPSFLFVPALIQPRRPLSPTARRAGWQGCNILLGDIPEFGRIPLLLNRQPVALATVRSQWQQVHSLFAHPAEADSKTWLLTTMQCLDQLPSLFSLTEVYGFEPTLQQQFPSNRHIRAKLRQQLQLLRNAGYLRFRGRGQYERLSP